MALSKSQTEELLVEQDGYVVTITLNRPERLNAISRPMLQELSAKMVEADKDPEVRCIILTGEGRGFCAGLSLAVYAAGKISATGTGHRWLPDLAGSTTYL